MECHSENVALAGPQEHVGTVTAKSETGPQTNQDTGKYFGAYPEISIVPSFLPKKVFVGGEGSFLIIVRNLSNVDLKDVRIGDIVYAVEVTHVSGTKGSLLNGDDDLQTMGWLIPILTVGELVGIDVEFSVPWSTPPTAWVANVCQAKGQYKDDYGLSSDIFDENSGANIEIVDECPPPKCPRLTVVKIPNTPSVPEPGAEVEFTIVIKNVSTRRAGSVIVETLNDSMYGDLSGRGDCAMPRIPAGSKYVCRFIADGKANLVSGK